MKIPDDDFFTFEATARLFGYAAKTFRRLVVRGFYPRPLGIGHNQYYTRKDVLFMLEYSPRWSPEGESVDDEDDDEHLPPKTKGDERGRKGTNSAPKGTKGDETG